MASVTESSEPRNDASKPDFMNADYQRHGNGWNRQNEEEEDDDDGSQYFLSEPSVSEEGSEEPSMRGLGFLSPDGSLSGKSTGSLQQSPDRAFQHNVFASPHLSEAGSSPGGNTSLSSRDSPFWPSKFHFMAYPPGESDQSWGGGSVEGQRSAMKVDANVNIEARGRQNGKSPTPLDNNHSMNATPKQREIDNLEAKRLRQNSKSPLSTSTSEEGRRGTFNFIRALRLRGRGALRSSRHGRESDPEQGGKRSEKTDMNDNFRSTEIDESSRNDGGKSASNKMSNTHDDGQQHSADDEKTADPPRRKKISDKSIQHHRRTRSGDAVAARLITGTAAFKVPSFPPPPLFAEDDEDEEDCRETSHTRQSASEQPKQDTAEITIGPYWKPKSAPQRIQKNSAEGHSPHDIWSLSDSTLSPIDANERGSSSYIPSFVQRQPVGSVSTLGIQDSDKGQLMRASLESGTRSPVDQSDRVGRRSSDSMATPRSSSGESRQSSKFSWISNHLASESRATETIPAPPGRENHEGFRNLQHHGLYDVSSESESSCGSSGSYESEDDHHVLRNRIQNFENGPSPFMKPQQKVVRPQNSPFANIGKKTRKFFNKDSYAPSTQADDADKYPTFICPNCKTRQREFFSISTAPASSSAAGYLAFYFFIYVIAALYIFGLQEGWNALDCIYFAVITLTTAGLGDFVPTSNGAKIICAIFIYFGVACIGLLLGSYLAGSLDEASQREAQAQRAESCQNCYRLKMIRETAKVNNKRKRNRRASYQSVRVSPTVATNLSIAKRFMSEAPNREADDHHQAIYERAEKRHKHRHFGFHSDPYESNTHASINRGFGLENQRHPGREGETGSHSSGEGRQRSGYGFDTPSNGGSVNSREVESGSKSSNDGHQRSAKQSLGVIDEFSAGNRDPGFASPLTPNQYIAPPSPGTTLGSPVTHNILKRQQHTRHQSLDISGPGFFENDQLGTRERLFSEDGERRKVSPVIYEEPSAYIQDGGGRGFDSEDEFESSESDSYESDSSESSILDTDDMKKPMSRIKTAKYVFLTLKQAVVNSAFIIALGSTGFYLIEKMSLVDSFYFTTVLLTTVGYGDIVPVTAPGKLFATVYVLVAGTVLLHNMSSISMIPLELRKRRIQRAVLTQFGDQLDDASLRELATGSLVRRLQLSSKTQSGLDECTREMFALAMLVRLGKVTEHDIRMTFAAFRRLDVGNDGLLNSQDIIVGMMQKKRKASAQNLMALDISSKEDPSSIPFAQRASSNIMDRLYFFGRHGSMHEINEMPPAPFTFEDNGANPEHESLLHNQSVAADNHHRVYSSMNVEQVGRASFDSHYSSTSNGMRSADLEGGGYDFGYEYGTTSAQTRPHRRPSDTTFC